MASKTRLHWLNDIYADIAAWAADRNAVARNMAAINASAPLVVVGEAMGPGTLRLSGVSYFAPDGTLGPTGRYLDAILRPLNLTIFPPRSIELPQGRIAHYQADRRVSVYCTDLCPQFPGRVGEKSAASRLGSILRPSNAMVVSAIERGFLRKEIKVIRPRAILLLGSLAYRAFFKHFLEIDNPPPVGITVKSLLSVDLPVYESAAVVPFFHPSPANPAFLGWYKENGDRLKESPLIRCLNPYLRCHGRQQIMGSKLRGTS